MNFFPEFGFEATTKLFWKLIFAFKKLNLLVVFNPIVMQ